MRVQQLAKALNITVNEIEEFLQEKVDAKYEGPNKKLEEDVVQIIVNKFGPLPEEKPKKEEKVAEVKATPKIEEPQVEENPVEESVTEETQKETVEDEDSEASNETEQPVQEEKPVSKGKIEIIETEETTLHIEDGVIKAPKIELRGIKVTGKIDLPEKKKPEPKTDEGIEGEVQTEESSEEKIIPEKPKFERKKRAPRKTGEKKKKSGPTQAEIRAKEDEKRAKIEAEIEEKKRQAKKDFYKTQVQPKAIANAKKKKKKKISEDDKHIAPTPKALKKEAPKSAIGKFLKWLNS
jgi:hypothetical protein